MIHYFPLEPSPERWTGFMDKLITEYLQDKEHIRYNPPLTRRGTTTLLPHAFYDPARVVEYRAAQLSEFADGAAEVLKDGDLVFLSDALVPGIETMGYMAHLLGVKLDIRGLLHAGSFTDHDLMKPAERWASMHENAIFDLCHEVYVGSHWIRDDVRKKRMIEPEKVVVTGFPLDPDLPEPQEEREPIVVFNGRLSPEKQPWLFRKLQNDLWDEGQGVVRWVNCIEAGLDKPSYYDLLSRAKVVVSFALQETFGTAIQEAVKLGCIPVVPNRCCYPEQFPAQYRYDTFGQAVDLVRDALLGRVSPAEPVDCSGAVERWFT